MTKLRARVRATLLIDFEHPVPEPVLEPVGTREGRETHRVANETEVLAGRQAAGAAAEELARQAFPNAELLVEEVYEITEPAR